MKKLFVLLAVAAVAAALLRSVMRGPDIHVFDGVSGPHGTTAVATPNTPPPGRFGGGGENGIGVLVTDASADWLGLVRGFKAHGIPFEMTTDSAAALRHEVVIAYPSISGKVLSGPALQGLAAHVRGGRTLLTFDLAGGGLEEIFGISGQVGSRVRNNLTFAGSSPLEERRTWFNGPRAEAQVGTYGLTPTTGETLASFDDGAAALVCRRAGGRACLLGIDVSSLAQRTMNGRAELVSPEPVNGYQPGMDVLFRWLRDLYVEGEATPFLIGTAPAGFDASLVLTHDVDFNRSVANSLAYADAIGRRGLSATFFMQTKYIEDYNDESFFTTDNLETLRQLASRMEIGSHSVSHSRQFKSFAMGDGNEQYPDYRPFVRNAETTRGGTVLGELRVSKYLIESLLDTPVRFLPAGLSRRSGEFARSAGGDRLSLRLDADQQRSDDSFAVPTRLRPVGAGADPGMGISGDDRGRAPASVGGLLQLRRRRNRESVAARRRVGAADPSGRDPAQAAFRGTAHRPVQEPAVDRLAGRVRHLVERPRPGADRLC
jgi:hypothetical protein